MFSVAGEWDKSVDCFKAAVQLRPNVCISGQLNSLTN